MRRFTLFLVFVLVGGLFTNEAHADRFDYFWDTKAHDRGQINMSYGYGFPRLDDGRFKFHKDKNAYRVEGVGPFAFKFEYGLSRQLSIGLSATYIQYTSDWEELRFDSYHQRELWFKYGTKLHDVSAMLRLNYHWIVTPRSDFYVGGGMGYNYWKSEDFTTFGPEDTTFNAQFKNPGPFAAELTMGYRLFFRERNAFYVEAGYGKSVIQAGFVFKFRHHKRE